MAYVVPLADGTLQLNGEDIIYQNVENYSLACYKFLNMPAYQQKRSLKIK